MTGRRQTYRAVGRVVVSLVTLILFGAATGLAQNRVELGVNVKLSRDTIGMDEQAVLEVVVLGATQDIPDPRLPTLPMFEVYSQGKSTNISRSNNQVQASVTNRYILVPTKPGSFPIENISVVSQNRRYAGNPVTLTVVSGGTAASPDLERQAQNPDGQSRDYFLEAVVSNSNPYVNEQVTLTLKYYIAVQYYGSPELIEPTTTGFWSELLGTRGPYQQRLNDRTYQVLERSYALFPTQTGELTIGRATITATVQTQQRSRRRDPFDIFGMLGGGQEVQVRSRPLTINVKRLPEQGRPDNFTGTIGRFAIKAIPDKLETDVNQPVTVSFAITGIGNIKSVAEPTIPDLPDFRVYRASSNESISKLDDRIGGTKTFEEVFIPRVPGQLDIPALAFSYFDPELGRYRTTHSQPIKLTVKRTEGYAVTPDLPYTAPDVTIGADARDIRFIKSDVGELRPPEKPVILSGTYLLVNAFPVLALLASIVARRRRERLTGDIGYARSRLASKEARRRLARAHQLADTSQATEFYAESSQVLLSFMADKLNISPHGLTGDKIAELLTERGAGEELIGEVIQYLRQCDFARYAPASVSAEDITQALAEAERLMVRMEEVQF